MKPEKFIEGIRKSAVTQTADLHRHLFKTADLYSATDPYWIKAQGLFNKLDADDREILLAMMRQSSVDTTSTLLSVLDGSTRIDGQNSDIVLKIEGESEPLGGNLQDIFLAAEEETDT